MSLNYGVEFGDGGAETYSAAELENQLRGKGYADAVVGKDGKSVSYSINGEMYDDDLPSLLQQAGGKVTSMMPAEFEESFIQPEWRRGLQALPDDNEARSVYIKSKLNKMGLQGEVVGSCRSL